MLQLEHLLSEVNRQARPWLERSLSGQQAEACVTLLATAVFQLDNTGFGGRLYSKARDPEARAVLAALHEGHTTIEVCCTNLVARCAVTALDLCGAATARIAGGRTGPLGGPERGLGTALRRLAAPAPASLAAWIGHVVTTPEWADLEELRHAVTHRWWRRDITVTLGEPPAFAGLVEVHVPSGKVDLGVLLPRLVGFAEVEFLDFLRRICCLR
jgi:hypothetical protein